MRKALVCGAGGFIASALVKRLKQEGYWVRGADQKLPEFSPTAADDFLQVDLREREGCQAALLPPSGAFDEVYQLAADMGGMGFIHSAECDIMRNSALININMIDAAARAGIGRYFFSSSVCIYRDMEPGEPELTEREAYPALPDNEYGWEKLYAERTALAYGRRYGMKIRIARFQNCYGPEGTWTGGREKAPAAICRKVAEGDDGGTIEVWGDGSAVRSYTYVDDMVDGIYRLTQSDLTTPTNIGSPEYVTVDELVRTVVEVAGKRIRVVHVDGPVGVRSRNFSNEQIYSHWLARPVYAPRRHRAYLPWIESQVRLNRTKQESGAAQASEVASSRRHPARRRRPTQGAAAPRLRLTATGVREYPLPSSSLPVMIHHHLHEFAESHRGGPSELGARLRRVASEVIHLAGSKVPLIDFDVSPPIERRVVKGLLKKSRTECDSPVATTKSSGSSC